MDALVVFESIFGNTREVARAIAEGLRSNPEIDELVLAEVGEAPASARGFGLVVIGGPIHVWTMTRLATRESAREDAQRERLDPPSKGEGIREWIERLPRARGRILAAAFDTAIQMKWFPTGSAARPAAARLKRRAFKLIARPEHFFVIGSLGPLVEGELARARAWGAGLRLDFTDSERLGVG
ncbi:Flavodoxin domain protein [Enhygromyxa salina]|uniref:Flavodoxin domain protein n=1 Tax=Enhygromyxa salina TaxID=215803 RepID=A0A2S9XR59_9BACT|nr:flavodoxin [Enhygromyxa salina]PRP95358.1 Flavodoxin domain protein [Enhygromyxa salina]